PAEAVDREVAEWVGDGGGGRRKGRERSEEHDQPLHRDQLRATGAQRTEKCGFSSSARRNHALASARSPRQRSIAPRWKNLSASCVPSRSECFDQRSASAQRPLRSSAQAKTSSPSIDGRSTCARRAIVSACRRATRWSTSNNAVSRSVRTPFATSRRWITRTVAYW